MPYMTCDTCGKEYYAPLARISKNKYHNSCSLKCNGIWLSQHKKLIFGNTREKTSKICESCGKAFYAKPSGNKRFCSRTCFIKSTKHICPVCGKEYSSFPSSPRKYCSQECYFTALKLKPHIIRTCADCGKEISRRARECCGSCSAKRRWKSKKYRDDFAQKLAFKFDPLAYTRNHKPTDIEQMVITALDNSDILHHKQYRPFECRYIYDEFIPPNILLEVDGTYWHQLPRSVIRDKRKKKWAEDHGYIFISLPEKTLREIGAQTFVNEQIEPILIKWEQEYG